MAMSCPTGSSWRTSAVPTAPSWPNCSAVTRTGAASSSTCRMSDAHELLRGHGLADRVEVFGGDFFDAVPAADVYVLSYILHDWDDASSGKILGSIARAASPGARLVVIEAVLPEGDAPHLAKMIDLTMLAMLTGRERTAQEYEALLGDAGFTVDRIVPTPSPFSVIEATLR
jgi:O-methyltransferase domain